MKAFTLIELLAVIIILAIVALIATPIILEVIDEAEKSADMSQAYLLLNGAEYLYTTSIIDNNTDNFIDKDVYSQIITSNQKPPNGKVFITADGKIAISVYINGLCYEKTELEDEISTHEVDNPEDCAPKYEEPVVEEVYEGYKQELLNGAYPKLNEGLIPIDFNASKQTVTVDKYSEWYDYENKEWANAVLVKESVREKYIKAEAGTVITESDILGYFVWIPRYRYEIFDTDNTNDNGEEQTINITFEDKNDPKSKGSNIGEMLTHPAFTFGKEELDGIWYGKFESTGSGTVNPINQIMAGSNLAGYFNSVLLISGATFDQATGTITYPEENPYTGFKGVSRLLKTADWSSVLYLTHSQYGIIGDTAVKYYFSSNSGWKNEISYSTTKNLYGVFYMNGNRAAFSMTIYDSITTNTGFTTLPPSEYYDTITGDITNGYSCNGSSCLGYAFLETTKWYNGTVSILEYPINATSNLLYNGRAYYQNNSGGAFGVAGVKTGGDKWTGGTRTVIH